MPHNEVTSGREPATQLFQIWSACARIVHNNKQQLMKYSNVCDLPFVDEQRSPALTSRLGYLAPQETLLGPLQDVGFTQEVLPGGVGAPQ